MTHDAGEAGKRSIRPDFNRSVMIDFKGAKITSLCIDCAASIAKKKITQSYIAAIIGFASGIFMIKEVGFFAPVLYAYLFWGTFFGWFYGGRIWSKLAKIDIDFWGIILLSLKILVSMIVGTLGGGIAQFLLYKKILKRHLVLQSLSVTCASKPECEWCHSIEL
jgi:hypothetical protein